MIYLAVSRRWPADGVRSLPWSVDNIKILF